MGSSQTDILGHPRYRRNKCGEKTCRPHCRKMLSWIDPIKVGDQEITAASDSRQIDCGKSKRCKAVVTYRSSKPSRALRREPIKEGHTRER